MLLDKTIIELNKELSEKKISLVDLVKECFANIEKYDKQINAFITLVDKSEALKQAAEKDKTRDKSKSPLYGMPFILKDTYNTKGIRTTCASKVLDNYIPPYNATVYQKLLDVGAILIGKTNQDAWGHGGSSENTDFDPVKNPWDTTRVAGGSSGGNGAAIVSRMAVFGIGEDTGGSIRSPAGWCNITGLKVTYGRVSRYGCIAYASSFDTVGPMAKTAQDCAIILKEIAGKDELDSTSSPKKIDDYPGLLSQNVAGLTIGWPKEFFGQGLDLEINQKIKQAMLVFEKLGVKIKEISLPIIDYAVPVYYLIAPSETSSNLARYDGIRYGNDRSNFTDETKRRIMIGTYALSAGYYDAYYKKAQKARTLFIKEYLQALSQCDAVIMPISPTHPTKIGELINDPVQNLLADIYTVSQNPVGVPSLAIPCGFSQNGLPIGMQIIGKMFDETLLLKLGYHYQKATDWHKRKPAIMKYLNPNI